MLEKVNYLEGLDYQNLSFPHKTYYELANELYANKENKDFDNGLPSHALWGIYKLFEMAEKSIQIFSGSLRPKEQESDFFAHPKLLKKVKEFLQKDGTKLDILIENNLMNNHPFLELKEEYQNLNIQKINTAGKFHHFVVSDERGYRFEEDDTNKKVIAKFNFNNPEIAKKLSIIFGLLSHDSKPV